MALAFERFEITTKRWGIEIDLELPDPDGDEPEARS
jgi:hypothetical protein